ncbi:MAG: hypothetical protein ACI8ZN_002521 [Bacteroidia bacterium]|jgi:hypothetical protein
MKIQENRRCKTCNAHYVGRANKVFCTVVCKSTYHRNLRSETKLAALRFNEYLIRNHGILYEILGEKKKQIKVNRKQLADKKFRFSYHTHTLTNSKGKLYHFIFNTGWMEFSDDEILVVRNQT